MRQYLLAIVCLLPLNAFAALQVNLAPSVPSPQPTGTTVNLIATATDSNPGILSYRYTIASGGVSRIVRDFSQSSSFDWAGTIADGIYLAQVTVRNNTTQETVQKSLPFRFTSRVSNGMPIVTASANPLVALFSAPACVETTKIRVQFTAAGSPPEYTDWRACNARSSVNIYVAGMRANTRYGMTAQTKGRSGTATGPTVYFRTGAAPSNLQTVTPVVPVGAQSSVLDNVLLSDYLAIGTSLGYPMATDIFGRPIWYYAAFNDPAQAGGLLVRNVPGGTMLVLANGVNSSNTATSLQILREIDLAGNALRETNATRIREQLDAMGLRSSCTLGGSVCAFTSFHHDAIRLPNGHTLVLGTEERMYPAGTQGSTTPLDVLGDVVVDLDENFQVVWYWDSFAHLDVNRGAILGETCTPGFQACPPQYLAPVSNDWLHANSLQYTSDHNLIVSIRHQDWVIKIDYADGQGTGNVIWRLGAGGDFSIASSDPSPWFSHQHDAGFESNGTFTVFDNGNTRVAGSPGSTAYSRGQAYLIDEGNMIATQILNSDLGVYSPALGSAQRLSNGNYHFLPGYNNPGPAQFSQSVEVLPNGMTNLRLESPAIAYRSFRMKTLYAPPNS